MLSQRGKPLLVHDGHTFGIQYVRKDKKYWQCNLSRKFNCKARVTTTDTGEIIVTNNEHCHTEIRQHLRKDYQRNKVMMNALFNLSNMQRHNVNNNLSSFKCLPNMLTCLPTVDHRQIENSVMDLAKIDVSEEDETVHDLSSSSQMQINRNIIQTSSENEGKQFDCDLREPVKLREQGLSINENRSNINEIDYNCLSNSGWNSKNELSQQNQ